jgi:hypothetical protein
MNIYCMFFEHLNCAFPDNKWSHGIVYLFDVKCHKCQKFVRKTFNVPIGSLGSEGGVSGAGDTFR